MSSVVIALLQSIHRRKKSWLTRIAIALLVIPGDPGALAQRQQSSANSIANGVYLYGESNRPDVVGKEYIILETTRDRAIGAFYLPRSEFSCFYGQFKEARLNLTIIDPFDGRKSKSTLTYNQRGLSASKQPLMGQPNYQLLSKVSQNDRRILGICKLQLKLINN
ncbi:hypothetical protein [Chamaesiphon sp. OTE_20_metabat_361]|uniref:hypothetical protein n=1 Tax=Chamaesiphon sp. OTE_20_metabat_361 TaxID=2964689 RepID=UPI00286A11BF|nr:hypothetical protein [Chamaesiphon sp. OTE_20_metabat_361]